ncbi:MAG: GNAT family N-acetyltransferase, partial [Nitrospira sp.]|nr:GNAT family N-acetyltransferase [Nitrospira sp.]
MKEPPAVRVRTAKRNDADSLVMFSLAMAWETERRRLDQARLRRGVLAVLSNPARGSFIIAETTEKNRRRVVGQLLLTYEWSDWRNGVFWWIQSVYVIAEARRQGVFSALYQHVRQCALQAGNVVGLRLYVERSNQP